MVEVKNTSPVSEHLEPNTSIHNIRTILRAIADKAYEIIMGKIPKHLALHPDFRLLIKIDDALTWYQNREWGLIEPDFKTGFYFNDLSVLDNCPWVCKFGVNTNESKSEFKYFCICFGDPKQASSNYGLQEIIEWSQQFDHPTLMKYNGELVKELKANS